MSEPAAFLQPVTADQRPKPGFSRGTGLGGPRCGLWAASAPGRLRPRSRARRPGPPPSFYDRPLLVLPGGDLRLVALGGLAGGDLHAPADAVQQQIQPGQGVLHPEPAVHDLGNPRQSPALIAPARSDRAGIQHRFQRTQLTRIKLAAGTAGALRDQGLTPARCQRFADIRVTLNCKATSRSLAPASIRSAAANRTRSRRTRSSAVSPPPSGYLIPPA